jgi:2-methylcitrate dehydratase PrpD
MEESVPGGGPAPSIVERLARFAAALRYDEIPPEVVRRAGLCLLDLVGVTLAGAREPGARPIAELVGAMGGTPEAALWGFGGRAPAALAALGNGAVGHHLELDDGHILGHVHPGASLIPAAFALAEAHGRSGRELVTAIVAGYEILIRIGRGLAASAMYDRGYHGPGLFGAFGAAAAAAAILRLDGARAAHALGNCCLAPAATFQAFKEGAAVKDLYCGWPAMTGTMAAQMAGRGIGGPRELFEGRLGFARAVAERYDLAGMVADLGRTWLLPTAYVKRHSACSFAHTMIDALLDLPRAGAIPPEEVVRVVVSTHRFAADLDEPAPRTVTAAKSSLPFCAALALTRGRALLADFTPEALADPGLCALAARTGIRLDPALDARHAAREQRRPVRVEIVLRSGERLVAEREVARGWPEEPLTAEEVVEKFHTLVEPCAGAARTQRLLETILCLPDLPDVSPLGRLLETVAAR